MSEPIVGKIERISDVPHKRTFTLTPEDVERIKNSVHGRPIALDANLQPIPAKVAQLVLDHIEFKERVASLLKRTKCCGHCPECGAFEVPCAEDCDIALLLRECGA